MAVRPEADLFLEHRPFVVRLCRILLRDADESEDAAQQVFLHAYRAVGEGVRPRKARSWLAAIARNECRSRLRHAASHPEDRLSETLAAGTPDPADAAAELALVAELRDELARLPERQREALLLREIRGLSYGELAATMDETGPAVESLLQRARRRLVQRLVGPALTIDWLRNLFGRLVPPGGTAEVATAGGAALVVAKLAAVSVTATTVGVAHEHLNRQPQAPPSHVAVEHSRPPVAARAAHSRVGHVRTSAAHRHVSGRSHARDEPARVPTSNSGPGSTSSPQPTPEPPPPVVAVPDNSGPGSSDSAAGTATVSFEEPSGSENSGPGSSSSGHDGAEIESDHSGHG